MPLCISCNRHTYIKHSHGFTGCFSHLQILIARFTYHFARFPHLVVILPVVMTSSHNGKHRHFYTDAIAQFGQNVFTQQKFIGHAGTVTCKSHSNKANAAHKCN